MNAEIKKQWVAALRSGEYKQIQGRLKRNGGFCCNGVLCDLGVKAGVAQWRESKITGQCCGGPGASWTGSHTIPDNVIAWAELGDDGFDPKVIYEENENQLSNLNDNEWKTFLEIADIIEQNL